MSFSKLKSVHFKRLNQSFADNEYVSWGIVDNDGKLTMWNLNYAMDVIKDNPHVVKAPEDVVKDVVKDVAKDVIKNQLS